MSVRRTLAAALAAGLLLAGCSDEPEPRFAPTESPSPSESETTAEPEAQTPEEFIREWVELDNQMQASGDTEAFLAASVGCDSCKSYADRVEAIYSNGGFIRTAGRTVLDVTRADGPRAYELEVDAAPTRFREREGGPIQSIEGGAATFRLVLARKADGWVVADEVQL